MLDRIKEETDELIILDESPKKRLSRLFLILGLFFGLLFYFRERSFYLLFLFIGVFYFILWLLDILVNYKNVTIDKKSQTVIIKNNLLKSINRIPFENLKEISIIKNMHLPLWKIYLIAMHKNIISIYKTKSELKAEILGEKLCKMTSKGISRGFFDDSVE